MKTIKQRISYVVMGLMAMGLQHVRKMKIWLQR